MYEKISCSLGRQGPCSLFLSLTSLSDPSNIKKLLESCLFQFQQRKYCNHILCLHKVIEKFVISLCSSMLARYGSLSNSIFLSRQPIVVKSMYVSVSGEKTYCFVQTVSLYPTVCFWCIRCVLVEIFLRW